MPCPDCGEDKPHYAKGLCKMCYEHLYRETNRERYNAYKRYWCEKNPEKRRASMRRYRETHPENPRQKAIRDARRNARKRALPDTLTPEQNEGLLVMGQAMYPGEELHLDHIVPLSRGGGTTRANCHYIPAILNQLKYNKLPEETYTQEVILWTK